MSGCMPEHRNLREHGVAEDGQVGHICLCKLRLRARNPWRDLQSWRERHIAAVGGPTAVVP